MTNAQLYHSLIENRVHTFEPDRRCYPVGVQAFCRECGLPASAEIHNVFPVEGKQFKSLTEAQTICSGYGSPENGFTCGREKDYDRPWCDNCQESADLDEREGENDPSLVYPHLLN